MTDQTQPKISGWDWFEHIFLTLLYLAVHGIALPLAITHRLLTLRPTPRDLAAPPTSP